MMLGQEHAQELGEHAAGAAEKFNAGETIIHHVSNSPISEPLIHLPKLAGIDFSVTKHVLMLWLVAAFVLVVVITTVRSYLRQDKPIPTGFMNLLEALVEFIRDSIALPNVGKKWVNTWTPLLLTFFIFIFCANAIGLVPVFDVLGLVDHFVLHTGEHSFIKQLLHGGTTATANYNVTAALAMITFSAIIIAGTSGMVAGSGLLFPGTYTRGQAFQVSMRRGLKMFFGIVPIILLAAFFESFFTRYTDTPDVLRATFILTSLAFVLWYFVWLPRHKAKTGSFRTPVHDKELPPKREHVIDFRIIKSAGEILSDTFSVLRRRPKITFLSLSVATALFGSWAFGLSTKGPADTFFYTDLPFWPFDILIATGQIFGNDSVPYLYIFQVFILGCLTLTAFRVLELEMDMELRPPYSVQRMLLALMPLLLPMPGFIALLKMNSGGIISMVVYPFLALWSAVIYFETLNPFAALVRAFRLMRWGQGLLIGFMMIVFNLLLFVFIEFPVWDRTLEFFSWLVPRTEGAMESFHMIATTCAAAFILYFVFMLIVLSGALQYFSSCEVADAANLQEEIEKIGASRQIRGLARE